VRVLPFATRSARIRIGIFVAVVLVLPFILGAAGSLWMEPRAKEASAAFQKTVSAGMDLSEIRARAVALGSDRFLVLDGFDPQLNVKKRVRVLWYSFPFGLWPVGHACTIPLIKDRAESIACGWYGT
jgi:hypothetical protein